MKLKFILLAGLISVMGFLSACNTVQGAGEDIQKGGQEIQKAAVKNK